MGTHSPGSIRKTRMMLAEALIRLVEKRSFKKISVGDICGEAMVSRSAFYSHFSDKYELLSFCMTEMFEKRMAAHAGQSLEAQLISLLESVQENRRAMYNVFMADLSMELLDIFRQTLNVAVSDRLKEMQCAGVQMPGPISMVASFYAGGLANVMLGWVRENCATPIEEVARCQCALLAGLGTVGAAEQKRQ